nr:MAG TPA: hypothetical protein [Caudoviricetes sp.]
MIACIITFISMLLSPFILIYFNYIILLDILQYICYNKLR